MPWKTNRTASITNKHSQFGIMGGLANRRTSGASSNRATNRLVIPRGAAEGLSYMKTYNLLSKNPLGSGGGNSNPKQGALRQPIKKAEATLGENVEQWGSIKDMITARGDFGLAANSKGKLYAVGGQDASGNNLKSGEVYDPTTDTWSAIADMSAPRRSLGLAAIDDLIYAVGGASNWHDASSSGEVYDPTTDTWSAIADMSTARMDFGLASLNGKLYAVGGQRWDTGDILSSVEVYVPRTDTWTPAQSMTRGRIMHGIAAVPQLADHTGLLFVAGGFSLNGELGSEFDTSVDVYSPSFGGWALKKAQLDQHDWLSDPMTMAAIDDNIYIVGAGEAVGTASAKVYNAGLNGLIKGTVIATKKEGQIGIGLAALNKKLYAVGGTSDAAYYDVLKSGEVYTPSPS